jgi:hypothetical protein
MPDLLHEFELGVWKAFFTHLLRVLYAIGGDKIQELNSRYVTKINYSGHFSDVLFEQISSGSYIWKR